MAKRFFIYGLLGWSIEIIWTGLCSVADGNFNLIGHTSVWMFLIYGFAAVIFETVHRFIYDCNFFARGCVWAFLIFAIEFLSGFLLRIIGVEAWYYDGRFSVMGVIRLDYLPVWFFVGLLFEKFHILLTQHRVGVKNEPTDR